MAAWKDQLGRVTVDGCMHVIVLFVLALPYGWQVFRDDDNVLLYVE